MAVTKTLLSAVPYVLGGDLRRAVDSWEFTMSFQNGVSGDSDYLYKEYTAVCPNRIIIKRMGSSKAAIDFTRAELEALCPINDWSSDFFSLTADEIEADTSYTLPS